jgi:hypothetical protein
MEELKHETTEKFKNGEQWEVLKQIYEGQTFKL